MPTTVDDRETCVQSDVEAMARSSITSDIVSSYSIRLDTSTKLLGMAIMFHVSMILPIQLHVENINLKVCFMGVIVDFQVDTQVPITNYISHVTIQFTPCNM